MSDDPQLTQLADEIVEMFRRVYALDLDDVADKFWCEKRAQGVVALWEWERLDRSKDDTLQ